MWKNGHSDAVLNIAGSGEELDLLKRMKLELGINNNVNVLGQVPHDEIYDLLKEADVFVTASEGEGCSISVFGSVCKWASSYLWSNAGLGGAGE